MDNGVVGITEAGTASIHATARAAAIASAIANALQAMGTIIHVKPNEFLVILEETKKPLVVYPASRFLAKHKYLTNYTAVIWGKLCFLAFKWEILDENK